MLVHDRAVSIELLIETASDWQAIFETQPNDSIGSLAQKTCARVLLARKVANPRIFLLLTIQIPCRTLSRDDMGYSDRKRKQGLMLSLPPSVALANQRGGLERHLKLGRKCAAASLSPQFDAKHNRPNQSIIKSSRNGRSWGQSELLRFKVSVILGDGRDGRGLEPPAWSIRLHSCWFHKGVNGTARW